MFKTTMICDGPSHLRAAVCRLIAEGRKFEADPAALTVTIEQPESDRGSGYLRTVVNETAGGEVHFDFDSESAKGRLSVRCADDDGCGGPVLAVNGADWGYLDMYDAAAGNRDQEQYAVPPQLLLYSPHNDDEAWLKVFVEADNRMTVVVHKEAGDRGSYHPRAFHSDHGDRIYTAPWDPAS